MWNQVAVASNKKRVLMFIFASTVLLYFVFSPAIHVLYYAHDDYRYAFGGWGKACRSDDGFEYMLTLGRPIQAYLDCLSYKFAYTVERMRDIRFLSIIIMGCSTGLLADWFCSLGLALGIAFFASGAFFLVPQMYLDAILTGSLPLPLSVFFVLLSYRCIVKAHRYSAHNMLQTEDVKIKKIIFSGLSALSIFLAMLSYPAMAFFFPTLVLTKLLFSPLTDWEKTRREIFQEILLFCSVCVIYFIFAYINMRYFPQAPVTDVAYQVNHPNLNPLEILKRFFIVSNVFNRFWALFPFSHLVLQGWLMIIVMLSGILLGVIRLEERGTRIKQLLQGVLFALVLILFSSAFILVMPSRVMEPRLLMGPISAGLVLLLFSIYQFRKIVAFIVVSLFFFMQGYQTNVAMIAYAFGYHQYLNFIQTRIGDYLVEGNSLRRIHYIVPRSSYPYDRFFLTNGALMQLFGQKHYAIEWCSLSRGTPGQEKDHQGEMLACLDKLPKDAIAVTYTYPNEPFRKTKSMLVMDMQAISVNDYVRQYFKFYFDVNVGPLWIPGA